MSSGFMGTEMTRYSGFFDELEKIAAEQRKDLTKEKFKRHLMAAGAVLAGGTIGHFGGKAAKAALLKRKGNIAAFIRKHPTAMKAAPAVAGGAGAGAMGLAALRTKKHLQYAETGNERSK